jgi:hypothetical protein
MHTGDSKLGWTITLVGFLLLIALNEIGLLLVLIPAATILAFGVLWLSYKPGGVTQGLK